MIIPKRFLPFRDPTVREVAEGVSMRNACRTLPNESIIVDCNLGWLLDPHFEHAPPASPYTVYNVSRWRIRPRQCPTTTLSTAERRA